MSGEHLGMAAREATVVVAYGLALWPLTSPASAQVRSEPLDVDESVEEILSDVRNGNPATWGSRIPILWGSLLNEPQDWPESRLDSLAEGVVEIILDDLPVYGLLELLLVEVGGGPPVADFDQLRRIVEAGPDRFLPRVMTLEAMGFLAEDPRAVNFLATTIAAPEEEFTSLERMGAIRALAHSEAGRARLRVLLAEGRVPDREARHYLRTLAARGFRLQGVPDAGAERELSDFEGPGVGASIILAVWTRMPPFISAWPQHREAGLRRADSPRMPEGLPARHPPLSGRGTR